MLVASSRLIIVATVSTRLLKAVLRLLNSVSVGVPEIVPTPLCAGLLGADAWLSDPRNVSCELPPSRESSAETVVLVVVIAVVFAVTLVLVVAIAVVFVAMFVFAVAICAACCERVDSSWSSLECARVTCRPWSAIEAAAFWAG